MTNEPDGAYDWPHAVGAESKAQRLKREEEIPRAQLEEMLTLVVEALREASEELHEVHNNRPEFHEQVCNWPELDQRIKAILCNFPEK